MPSSDETIMEKRGGWLSSEPDEEVFLVWPFTGTSPIQAIKGSEQWDPGKLPGSHTVLTFCFCLFLLSVLFLWNNSGSPSTLGGKKDTGSIGR